MESKQAKNTHSNSDEFKQAVCRERVSSSLNFHTSLERTLKYKKFHWKSNKKLLSYKFPSERRSCHFLYINQTFDEKLEKISTFFFCFNKNFKTSVSDENVRNNFWKITQPFNF